MIFRAVLLCFLLSSINSQYSFDLSASFRWGTVRDNMLCFVRLAERDIAGVTIARRGTGENSCKTYCSTNSTGAANFTFNSPDFSDCGFFQVCLSGRCTSLSNITVSGQSNSNLAAGIAALRRMYLGAFLPGGAAIASTGAGSTSSISALSQAIGLALPALLATSGSSGALGSVVSDMNPAAIGASGAALASNIPALAAAMGTGLPVPPSGSLSTSINSASGPLVGGILPNFAAVPPASNQAANLQAAVSSLGSMAASGAELASSSAGLAGAVSNAINAANRG
ncbi:uncharacterized protein LOC141853031 [Brevipalpus obovatus]|uniref:uncharacterized protein LOC141853031 n=1 Tax=Brevipalpus obovatus TaxID=246614 RepID=UPI003D9F8866